MHLGQIIKDFRTKNKMNMADFAEKANISKAYVSVLERNKDPRNGKPIIPSLPTIQNVASAIGMSFEEVFNQLGDEQLVSLVDTSDTIDQPILTVYNELHEPRQEKVLHFAEEQLAEQQAEEQSVIKEETVTYLNTYRRKIAVTEAVAAGRGFSYGDNDTEYCYTDQENLPNFDIASYVTGDSMEPHYHDGDVVLIRKEMYANPAVYVVDYDGKSYLKKVYRESDQFCLVSFNKNYDDIIIDLPLSNDTYLNIVGRVVGSFRPVEEG